MSSLETVKVVLKSLLVSSSQNLTCHQLNKDYKAREGQDIPFSKLGYRTLTAFLLSCPDTLTLNTHTGVVTAVVPANSKNAHVQKLVKEQKQSKINRRDRDRGNSNMSSRRQISTPQSPLWDTLPLLYNSPNYNQLPTNQMMWRQNNFEPGNLLLPPSFSGNMATHIPANISMMNRMYRQSLLPYSTAESTNRTIRRSNGPILSNGLNGSSRSNGPPKANNSSNQNKNDIVSKQNRNVSTIGQQNDFRKLNGHTEGTSENHVKEIAALPDFDDDDPIPLIGTSYSGSLIGKSVPAAIVPVGLKNGDIHQINIKEITSNWHFFFQFFESQECLTDMTGEIRDSCVTKNLNLTVNKSQLSIGTTCAAFFSDKWLRAEVLGQSGDDLVKVLFIDFGTIANVSIKNIRWLLAKFCHMPRLCHRGALSFLEQTDNYKIEKMVTKIFCKMVRDKSMMGVISYVNENNTIFMTVIDTSQEQEDVVINKILIESLLTANKRKL